MKIFNYYIIVINIIGFFICFIDKQKALYNKYRIKEKTLFLISLIGGCVGFYLGMILFRHKTKKLKFILLIPLFIVIWVILYIVICCNSI